MEKKIERKQKIQYVITLVGSALLLFAICFLVHFIEEVVKEGRTFNEILELSKVDPLINNLKNLLVAGTLLKIMTGIIGMVCLGAAIKTFLLSNK